MKEATGELNMTVITVVAIAGVAALFTVFIWPSIQKTIKRSTVCSYGAGFSGDGISCEEATTTTDGKSSYKCTVTAGTKDQEGSSLPAGEYKCNIN